MSNVTLILTVENNGQSADEINVVTDYVPNASHNREPYMQMSPTPKNPIVARLQQNQALAKSNASHSGYVPNNHRS